MSLRDILRNFQSRNQRTRARTWTARPQVETLEDRTVPATLLALNSATNAIVRFDSATPGTTTTTAIGGLNNSETVLGMDFRPANGLLYAVTNQNRLLTINPTSGAATAAAALTADPTDATNPFTALNGTAFGVDFNPVPDRLRVVSDTNQNLRINPANGRVLTDENINPGTPDLVASAYLNNFAGTTATTLYGIDAAAETLVIQNPPNNGTLATVGTNLGAGIDATLSTGFDIVTTGGPTRVNTAYATLVNGGVSGLYTIDLTAGTASLVGAIGAGATQFTGLAVIPAGTLNFSADTYLANEKISPGTFTITRTGGSLGQISVDYEISSSSATAGADFSILNGTVQFGDGDTAPKTFGVPMLDDQIAEGNETVKLHLSNATNGAVIGARGDAILSIRDNESPSILLYGITPGNVLVEFAVETPDVIRRSTPILNLNAGDIIEGIDFRPANNQLYALVVNGGNSRLVTIDRRMGTATNVGTLTADPADASDPFTSLSGSDFGFDFNPTNDRIRIVSDADINLSVNPANGLVTTQTDITGGTPNAVGAAYTNSFSGAGSTTLFVIDSGTDALYSQNPPANGVLTLVGSLDTDTSGLTGFEIAASNNQAFASLTSPGATSSTLFSIDLSSGAASKLGTIGVASTLNGLTSQEVNDINYSDYERFVNRLFRDFFGRNAEDAGRVAFTDLLNKGWSRDQVAKEVMKSPEYRGVVVEDLYRRLLHRPSDAGGKAGYVALLGSGHSVEEVTSIIVGSEEYFQIHGATNSQFLDALYLDLLGRPIDASGQSNFLAALNSGTSRQTVASWILGSQEYQTRLVTNFYTYFLLRQPDAGGLAAHVGFLQDGATSNDVLAGFLGSAEYFARTQ